MKRIGFLFEPAFTPAALLSAFYAAARNKRGKRACFKFEKHLASNLDTLHSSLHDGSYRPMPYYSFKVYEPKPRQIYAPSFRDLVVQHAIYAAIVPIFDKCFIEQSFACRTGKGTHKAADFAQSALQNAPADSYTLKLDIRKFFYRIDRSILRTQIERKIKDRRFVDLMMVFADYGEPVGIPIGNLLSQIYALIYLNSLDHYIKRDLGARSYCRYVDDFVVFGEPRARCLAMLAAIQAFIAQRPTLELSRYTLAKTSRGINFVGYRTWASKRFIRKHSLFTFKRRAKSGRIDSIVSIIGHAKNTHSRGHLFRYLKEHHDVIYRQVQKIRQHGNHPRTPLA